MEVSHTLIQLLVCRWVALEDPVDGSQPWGALWPGEVLQVYMHQLLCQLLLPARRSMQAQLMMSPHILVRWRL